MKIQISSYTMVWWLVGAIESCIKQILRIILGRAALDFEELYTVVWDIEGLIRPLTIISEDSDD